MLRLLDFLLALLAVLLLSPLLALLALLLSLTGEREVLFTQKRVGRGGNHFNLLKFATMLKDSPNMATGTITVRNDPRILPLGRFLRFTKLNELPQLFNILKGEMSVIGPRPQTQRCFDAFPQSSQVEIAKVRPGLSGIGSIIFRAEEKMINENSDPESFYDNMIMPYKGQLEEWYVSNKGLMTYLSCIWCTLWIVFFPKSRLVWKIFQDLPEPPQALAAELSFH